MLHGKFTANIFKGNQTQAQNSICTTIYWLLHALCTPIASNKLQTFKSVQRYFSTHTLRLLLTLTMHKCDKSECLHAALVARTVDPPQQGGSSSVNRSHKTL